MGYQEALEAAGAVVHQFETFGSYQGDWWAKVTYKEKSGWVNGYYGSCSQCDAFEGEFGWYPEKQDGYQERLKKFGEQYLEEILSQQDAEKTASKNLSYDLEAENMVKFIKDNA
jgi:hypothetical protein